MTHGQDSAATPVEPTGPAYPDPAHPEAAPTDPGTIEPVGYGKHGKVEHVPVAKIKHTRVSGTWVAVIVALVVLVFLLIFILQNLDTATVHFLGIEGSLPLGVAMLFSVIAGGVLVALIGGARILQLRKQAKKPR
ncbi:LapA family protein [Amycolatopsis sp. H20-H5]|uniref:LapA family protein n=1 Tax=Amycolatopsis sp. H20-H5 TaxID=3046309 RepID=UPI002DBDDD6C|nr:lipopolysaccharide assembly protein LapA domain-containing protein [Amycolatopsis sp. H20-H5]MEC3979932.1 lipopolysaccharide assembly protein LapA domain-containing protein [Amycolatopsis sp. H20-H5]